MLLRAYSIYDNKALVYRAPFFASTNGEASRSFADLANDINTIVGKHPADYSLFCVGAYDDQKGQLHPLLPIEHVVDALTVYQAQQPFPFTEGSSPPNGKMKA